MQCQVSKPPPAGGLNDWISVRFRVFTLVTSCGFWLFGSQKTLEVTMNRYGTVFQKKQKITFLVIVQVTTRKGLIINDKKNYNFLLFFILIHSSNCSESQFVTVCYVCLYDCFVTPQRRQLLCQVLRPCLYATGGRRYSKIIYPGLKPHHCPVFSLHHRLPAISLHLSLSPELSSDGWHQLPRKTTFPAAAALLYTSTPLLDEW